MPRCITLCRQTTTPSFHRSGESLSRTAVLKPVGHRRLGSARDAPVDARVQPTKPSRPTSVAQAIQDLPPMRRANCPQARSRRITRRISTARSRQGSVLQGAQFFKAHGSSRRAVLQGAQFFKARSSSRRTVLEAHGCQGGQLAATRIRAERSRMNTIEYQGLRELLPRP